LQIAVQLLYQGYATVTKVLIVENEDTLSLKLDIATPIFSL